MIDDDISNSIFDDYHKSKRNKTKTVANVLFKLVCFFFFLLDSEYFIKAYILILFSIFTIIWKTSFCFSHEYLSIDPDRIRLNKDFLFHLMSDHSRLELVLENRTKIRSHSISNWHCNKYS